MIQWNIIWDQSAVGRAVCQRAGRSQLGPPQFHWEPWHRAALVLSPHFVWAVRVLCLTVDLAVADPALISWLGFRPGTSMWVHWLKVVIVTRPALLFLLGHCVSAPLPEVPAVLSASPAHLCFSGSPSSSAAATVPSSWCGPQHLRVSETAGGDGQ
ncbi:hypothetical protein Nmel_015548 [Mimus melanotis]